ncbi:MAG TPA: hypothetical protein PK014_09210 [Thermoanaerobaculia bacterium]|nr:hypothetical protein [Thermoanaerobaculia bacterium]HUM30364.1 hypothetical protein [Thermoanaerobaculia bacterium]HXK68485.1 hypothetical protein [Thermoanaerobaculia bacterium]
MHLHHVKFVLIIFLTLTGRLAPALDGSPFNVLDSKLHQEMDQINRTWSSASPNVKPVLEQKLTTIYQRLHDIRHYKAFEELWNNIYYSDDEIVVLYPASGSHLAPLEIVHSSTFQRVTFIYTEIDPNVIPRLEATLLQMVDLGFYSDLSVTITPLQTLSGSRGDDRNPKQDIASWLQNEIQKTGTAPPIELNFFFKFKHTNVLLKLLINASSQIPGSSSYFRAEDISKANLVITHDLSFDPRENLSLLFEILDSRCTLQVKTRLLILMEDLNRYPFPLDLSPLDIIKTTEQPYGHASFLALPSGTLTPFESGQSLYRGATVLEPDLHFWCALSTNKRKNLFDLILFRDYGFNRRNVDLIDGHPVFAPAILDWYNGYAYKDIINSDLREYPNFLSKLVESCITLLSDIPKGKNREWLCNSLNIFKTTLSSISTGEPRTIIDEALKNGDLKFLHSNASRTQYTKALASTDRILQRLKSDVKQAKEALRVYKMKANFLETQCSSPKGFSNHHKDSFQ